MQKVVRTYTGFHSNMKSLIDLLSQGFNVIMCNEIRNKDGSTTLEYIVEKTDDICNDCCD